MSTTDTPSVADAPVRKSVLVHVPLDEAFDVFTRETVERVQGRDFDSAPFPK